MAAKVVIVQTHFRRAVPFLTIFLFAFTLRLIYLQGYRHYPLFAFPQVDAETYLSQAKQMADGHFFQTNRFSFYQPPLYPVLLAACMYFITTQLYWIHLFQMILGSINCLLLYQVGKYCFSPSAAVLAALASGCYWPLIYFDGELLPSTVAIFFILLFMLFWLKFIKLSNRSALFLSGVSLGFAAIAIPNILLFGWTVCPIAILSSAVRGKSPIHWIDALKRLLIFAAASILPLAPISLYHWHLERVFVPISHNGGLNFYIGNSPKAENAVGIRPGEEWDHFIQTPQRENPQSVLSSAAFSMYWYKKSWQYIHRQPVEFVKNFIRKLFRLLDAYETKRNMDIYFFRQKFSTLMKWPLLGFGVVLPLSLLGLVWPRPANPYRIFLTWYLCIYGFSVIIFFVTARYRLPLTPVLLLFAAHAFLHLLQRLRTKRLPWKQIAFLTATSLWIHLDPAGVRPSQAEQKASQAESWYYLARSIGDAANHQDDPADRVTGWKNAIQTMQVSAQCDSSFAYPLTFIGIYSVQIAKQLLKDFVSQETPVVEKKRLLGQVAAHLACAEGHYRQAHALAPLQVSPVYNLSLALFYQNIVDFNNPFLSPDLVRAAIVRRCDEIALLLDQLLQQKYLNDLAKYTELQFKAAMQREQVLQNAIF
ncbi:MAG TPA: glycosyltransferase family 39 protein [bacterium]|nr:glycosyltransferase family 39 protein [bacterium]